MALNQYGANDPYVKQPIPQGAFLSASVNFRGSVKVSNNDEIIAENYGDNNTAGAGEQYVTAPYGFIGIYAETDTTPDPSKCVNSDFASESATVPQSTDVIPAGEYRWFPLKRFGATSGIYRLIIL